MRQKVSGAATAASDTAAANGGKTVERIEATLARALAKRCGVRPRREYRFHPTRRWRFDLAFVKQKLAIEIDGNWHLTNKQRRSDCEKQNAATEQGWRVLVYPARSVATKKRQGRIVEQIARVLCEINDDEQSGIVLNGD